MLAHTILTFRAQGASEGRKIITSKSDDLISRQAAIEAAYPFDDNERNLIDALEELPSAVVEGVQRNEYFNRVIEELMEIEAKNDIGYFTSTERSQFNAYVEDLLFMTIERAEA